MTDGDSNRPLADANSGARRAGGVFVAIGAALGALAGAFLGEPSAGFLGGLVLGALAALALWWRDTARR